MSDQTQTIFREKAVKRYFEAQNQAVLPPTASRRTVAWLWVFLGLLLTGGLVTALAIIRILAHE